MYRFRALLEFRAETWLALGVMRRVSSKTGAFAVALASLVGAACGTGAIGDASGGSDQPPVTSNACTADPGPSPIRRLTRFEYDATVRDLLGDDSAPARAFPAEEESHGFTNDANVLSVTPALAEAYMVAAEKLAARAVDKLPFVLPCDPAREVTPGAARACAKTFLRTFGSKAFRRPIEDLEVTELLEVFEAGRAQSGAFKDGLRLALAALLQSPAFLYRVEVSPALGDGVAVPLGPYEMASRLSYLLWGSMPDDALFTEAAAGRLSTAAEIEAQARRMLKDPKTEEMVAHFHEEWLSLSRIKGVLKSSEVYPDWSPELRDDLAEETRLFVNDVFFRQGTLDAFLGSSTTFVNARLAAFYGVPAPEGSGFVRVELPKDQRMGFLTQGSFLAMNAKPNQPSPIHRGKFVREKLFCDLLLPPPNNIVIKAPDPKPGSSARERFAEHTKDATCRSCHKLMDPIGFGFEHYDGIGRYLTTENGKPIDATGEVVGTDVPGAFDGLVELRKKLGASQQVSDCMVTQWFRYGYGRAETEADRCTLARLGQTFTASGRDFRELLVHLAVSDAFRFRRPITQASKGAP